MRKTKWLILISITYCILPVMLTWIFANVIMAILYQYYLANVNTLADWS